MTRYTSLDAVLNHIWEEVEAAAQSNSHPYRPLTFGTVHEGAPNLRTVVLRKANAEDRTLHFHTDRRSRKVSDLQTNDQVAWHGWDETVRQQIRLRGTATVHLDDDIAMALWESQPPKSLVHYVRSSAPGTTVDEPGEDLGADLDADAVTEDDVARGRQHFAVVRTTIQKIDWLHLHPDGHYRAQFDYQAGEKTFKGDWIVP